MTDPVDTDAKTGVAALETDLLKKDVAFWIGQSDTWKRLANDERDVADRLRAVIKNAPHAEFCGHDRTDALAYRGAAANCTCWKADV